jgi:hypothetical protein
MNLKHLFVVLFALLLQTAVSAQEKALDLIAGAVYPIRVSKAVPGEEPRLGMTFGLLYRRKNVKGDIWSVGAEYQLLQLKSDGPVSAGTEKQTQKFEFLHLYGYPLIWSLGAKKRVFIEAGGFFNFVLHEETEVLGNVVNNTKNLQRTSVGPSFGLSVQLGETMRKSLLVGVRNDYAAASFGKKANGGTTPALRFNNISLYIGLGI